MTWKYRNYFIFYAENKNNVILCAAFFQYLNQKKNRYRLAQPIFNYSSVKVLINK